MLANLIYSDVPVSCAYEGNDPSFKLPSVCHTFGLQICILSNWICRI